MERDVVVVGAGMAGLYSLHHFRRLGFATVVLEQGGGVGGTWYWNRYPGARCDVPSLEYSFGFDADLEQEWEWTEIFPSQPELETYLNHVADRFDLRRDIHLDTRVVSATFDAGTDRWVLRTDTDLEVSARFCVMATGCLSKPLVPDYSGFDDFGGQLILTSTWPRDTNVADLAGKRIALIGTGSSGVQSTPELAAVADHLYVFQRTPTFTWPSHNGPLDPEVQAETKLTYRELRAGQRRAPGGVVGSTGAIVVLPPGEHPIAETTEEERLTKLEELGFSASRVWSDLSSDPEANEMACELYRMAIRRVVTDPDLAEALSPRGFPIGCKRPVIDTGYFETFNRDNVTLVDLREGAIERFTETGVLTAQGAFDVDVIVLATGFDAMTGALLNIDIRGRDGESLAEAWAEGPRNLFGLQVAGFPNLFTITGPGSPSVLSNMVIGIEQHVEWIGDCLVHLREHGYGTIEASPEAQDEWVHHVNSAAAGTTYTSAGCNSWYLGANVPGKQRIFMPYIGGFDRYIARVEAAAEAGYEGFLLA